MAARKTLGSSAELVRIEKEIKEQEDKLAALRDERRNNIVAHRKRCPGCLKFFKVGETTFIRRSHYIPPYGCSGGAYWEDDKRDAYLRCPHCESVLRIPEGHYLRDYEAFFKDRVSIPADDLRRQLTTQAKGKTCRSQNREC